ncbi:MAG: G8 domain-containing protein [Pseudomonadota bacterium]
MPAIAPPGVGASAQDIAGFVAALGAMPDTHSHGDDTAMAGEHMAVMALAPRGDATHIAIGDGDWFDPSIWAGGEVPGDNAKVLIPDGVTVDYGDVSDARLFTVRVDGKLDFATDADSQMIFDTMLVSPTGHLEIGTEGDPVAPGVNVDLIVANNGPIDTDWDPMLLSRGVISHGKTTIHGDAKDSHEKVTDDPMAGDTSVKFDGVPEGWQIGDTIVIASTEYEFRESQDEVRVITKIDDDGRIHFDDALVFDHAAPRDDLSTSVANYTRNVSVETEDADSAEVYERGHVMFMHSDDIDVRFAEFTQLGRTDKSIDSDNVSNFDDVQFDTNVQGRYSLHIHRAGIEDLANPAVLEGNAVFGSPGWGVVHHDSNAVLTNNATFDTFGAGFVAETGNETGRWEDNIAIFAEGQNNFIPKNAVEIHEFFDTARGGDGFWFQGRLVEAVDNVAASVNTGFTFFHRGFRTGVPENIDADHFDYSEALSFRTDVQQEDAPILVFDGNESFAAKEGFHVVKGNTAQGHDVWSHLTDFTAWSVDTGAHFQYTSHYLIEGFDVVGTGEGRGIEVRNQVSELIFRDTKIDNFEIGFDLETRFVNSFEDVSPDKRDLMILDSDIQNVQTEYYRFQPEYDTISTHEALNTGDTLGLDLDPIVFNYGEAHINGVKHDGFGTVDFPNGLDDFLLRHDAIDALLENNGYWTSTEGPFFWDRSEDEGLQHYILTKVYFTDRATGEVYFENHPIYVHPFKVADMESNGIRDITTNADGVKTAGDVVLDTAFAAEPTGGFSLAYDGSSSEAAMLPPEMHSHMADMPEAWHMDAAEDSMTAMEIAYAPAQPSPAPEALPETDSSEEMTMPELPTVPVEEMAHMHHHEDEEAMETEVLVA